MTHPLNYEMHAQRNNYGVMLVREAQLFAETVICFIQDCQKLSKSSTAMHHEHDDKCEPAEGSQGTRDHF